MELIFDSSKPIKTNSRFADVFIGYSNNSKVLIKKIKKDLSSEHTLLYKLQTENTINKLYFQPELCSLINSDDKSLIVRPYIEGLTLDSFFKSHRIEKKNKLLLILDIWIKTLEQLNILHQNEIIHRDLKPQNILLASDKLNPKELKVKLIDFGQSNFLYKQIEEKRIPFSLQYSPPEQVLNFRELCSFPSDLYSIGLCFYELITKQLPFNHSNPEMLMNLMISLPLNFSDINNKKLENILTKSTFKSSLGKPPAYFSKSELKKTIQRDIENRYQYIHQYLEDLEELKYTEMNKPVKTNFFKRLFH